MRKLHEPLRFMARPLVWRQSEPPGRNTMKRLMTTLMISGVALMAQTGSAPASSSNATSSTNAAPTTKVRKHHKTKKNVTPNATSNSATPDKPASK